ncbi:MAG: extracellular solute-binding protein [Oscillospiraceae bacterium]|jgi:multiple sugar transport system substrate-binding protein|nr:extracellular solute-binding protein [Oscillospiraceae bacterium]
MQSKSRGKRFVSLCVAAALCISLLAGCDTAKAKSVKLDPDNPVTVSLWHYYNGATSGAFSELVNQFNETVGLEKGIIVETHGFDSIPNLETAVMSSVEKKVGSMELPNIFASYADNAYAAEKLGVLANLDDYFSEEEQSEYFSGYIEEGKIGLNGELRIFPIAKSTEIFLLNDTDWRPFADANGLTYDDLATKEGLAKVSKLYYEWTDAKTPKIKNDGKAFFGRDSMANLFIMASKQFGTEIFDVTNGKATINVREDVMRKIWELYYIPYIAGYYKSYGLYRSDDTKLGEIVAYIGSTSSSSYFPTEVITEQKTYPIELKALPVPNFEGGEQVMVQQGAGMVVTKSTPAAEYASVVFLKWLTDINVNTVFSAASGYMPVKKAALDYSTYTEILEKNNIPLDDVTRKILEVEFAQVASSELYTNKAFDGGVAARAAINDNLQNKAVADRATVEELMRNGATHANAVAQFDTEANFTGWYNELVEEINRAVGK